MVDGFDEFLKDRDEQEVRTFMYASRPPALPPPIPSRASPSPRASRVLAFMHARLRARACVHVHTRRHAHTRTPPPPLRLPLPARLPPPPRVDEQPERLLL